MVPFLLFPECLLRATVSANTNNLSVTVEAFRPRTSGPDAARRDAAWANGAGLRWLVQVLQRCRVSQSAGPNVYHVKCYMFFLTIIGYIILAPRRIVLSMIRRFFILSLFESFIARNYYRRFERTNNNKRMGMCLNLCSTR